MRTSTVPIHSQSDTASCSTISSAFLAFSLRPATHCPINVNPLYWPVLHSTSQATVQRPPIARQSLAPHTYPLARAIMRVLTAPSTTMHNPNTHLLQPHHTHNSHTLCSKHSTPCAAHYISAQPSTLTARPPPPHTHRPNCGTQKLHPFLHSASPPTHRQPYHIPMRSPTYALPHKLGASSRHRTRLNTNATHSNSHQPAHSYAYACDRQLQLLTTSQTLVQSPPPMSPPPPSCGPLTTPPGTSLQLARACWFRCQRLGGMSLLVSGALIVLWALLLTGALPTTSIPTGIALNTHLLRHSLTNNSQPQCSDYAMPSATLSTSANARPHRTTSPSTH